MKKIAVVTGASSGMGKEFVLRLAQDASLDEIWVIARRKERLEALQREVSGKIRPMPMDLTKPESIEKYKRALEREKPFVAVLVNASGVGRFGAFEAVDMDTNYNMIDLNVKAYVGMTYATLPFLHEGSQIYQLASLSSFQPVPYINVYGATKAFTLSFSRALNVELKPRKIKVMAVCPGWVKTEFFDHAVTDSTITYYNHFYTPEQVVRRAFRDMKRGKDVSICGFRIRAQVRLVKLLPHSWVMKIWCKQQKK
ncbi:MAG: SDR family NAD(P)-dependent oxidoreductase [Clostridia bacterium]|nr:SDR family NAD(P)-dependent oxidoreductase [Clostridia bacterium]